MKIGLAAWLLWLPLLAAAAGDERSRIAAERRAQSERFAAEEKDCAGRFFVTACIDDVRLRRREALQPLRDRELRLEQAERTKRATERREAIASKQAAAASRPVAADVPPPPQLRLREPMPTAARPAHVRDEAERESEAAARARESERRREEIQADQRRVQQREAERAANPRRSAPLPVPAASAASGAR